VATTYGSVNMNELQVFEKDGSNIEVIYRDGENFFNA
jgi:hypothetical protein